MKRLAFCLLLASSLIAPVLAETPLERMQRETRAAALRQEGVDKAQQNELDARLARIERNTEAAAQAPPPARSPEFVAAVRESKRVARLLYPDLTRDGSPLAAKVGELLASIDKSTATVDTPLLVTVQAANLLGIRPTGSGQ